MITDGCNAHAGVVHGGEAEELRRGIEELLRGACASCGDQLARLLDRVDARDSLAFVQQQAEVRALRARVADLTVIADKAKGALYDAMHAGHLSRAYAGGVIAELERVGGGS